MHTQGVFRPPLACRPINSSIHRLTPPQSNSTTPFIPHSLLLLLLLLALLQSPPALAFFSPSPSHNTCARAPRASTLTMAASASTSILASYQGRKPRAPLPPIILSNVPGTWAYDTMSRRIRDDILARIYAGAWWGFFGGWFGCCTVLCCAAIESDWKWADPFPYGPIGINLHSPTHRSNPQTHTHTYGHAENDLADPKLAGVKEALDQLKTELQTPQQSALPPVPDDGGPDIQVCVCVCVCVDM
jgi:hypothetical protein